MTKKNDALKEEALKLRESGMIIPDIVKQTRLSKATLGRLFKKHNLLDEKLRLSHINNELPQNKGEIEEDKNANQTIESKETSFKGSKVTYLKNGSIEIENSAHNVPAVPPEEKPVKSRDTEKKSGDNKSVFESAGEPTVNAVGMGQAKPAPISRKPDIDAPDNMLDQFFSRGLVSTLVPLGLVVAGYMMSKKDKEQDNTREDW